MTTGWGLICNSDLQESAPPQRDRPAGEQLSETPTRSERPPATHASLGNGHGDPRNAPTGSPPNRDRRAFKAPSIGPGMVRYIPRTAPGRLPVPSRARSQRRRLLGSAPTPADTPSPRARFQQFTGLPARPRFQCTCHFSTTPSENRDRNLSVVRCSHRTWIHKCRSCKGLHCGQNGQLRVLPPKSSCAAHFAFHAQTP